MQPAIQKSVLVMRASNCRPSSQGPKPVRDQHDARLDERGRGREANRKAQAELPLPAWPSLAIASVRSVRQCGVSSHSVPHGEAPDLSPGQVCSVDSTASAELTNSSWTLGVELDDGRVRSPKIEVPVAFGR